MKGGSNAGLQPARPWNSRNILMCRCNRLEHLQSRHGRGTYLRSLLLVMLFAAGIGAADVERAEAAEPAETVDDVSIPFDRFTLDNGLTVIVHTDRKAPIVAVNLWYHVGSKNEPAGRTGFAHLFEHLMFQGTENYDDEYFKPLELVGATSINGTTSFDRTNYF